MVLQHPLKAWYVHVCAQGHTCLHTHLEAIGQPQMSSLGILPTFLCSFIGLERASPRDYPPPISQCTRGEKAHHKGDLLLSQTQSLDASAHIIQLTNTPSSDSRRADSLFWPPPTCTHTCICIYTCICMYTYAQTHAHMDR